MAADTKGRIKIKRAILVKMKDTTFLKNIKCFLSIPSAFLLQGLFLSTSVFANNSSYENISPQLFALAGVIVDQNGQNSEKPALELAYLSPISDNFTLNTAYLNEGHFNNHFRDGLTIEPGVWFPCPDVPNLNFNIALGPYFYADTIATSTTTYENQHGIGAVISANIIWQAFAPYLFNLSMNHIQTFNDGLTTNSLLFGIGIDLDGQLGKNQNTASFINVSGQNQLNILVGDRALNSVQTLNSLAYSIAYHYLLNSYFNWSLNYIHEGKTVVTDRNGVALMGWGTTRFDENRFMLGLGLGPYFSHDISSGNRLDMAVGGETGYFVAKNIALTLEWDRIITSNNTDSDLYLGGVTWLF